MTGIKVSYDQAQSLAKYVMGTAAIHSETLGDAARSAGSYAIWSAGSWAWKNRKNLSAGFEAVKANQAASVEIMNKATESGKTISNIWKGAGEITAKAELETIAAGTSSSAGAAQAALDAGGNYAASLDGINKAATTTLKGKVGSLFGKGGGTMAVLHFGSSVFTDIIPAFKLGTGKGFKQLGKSAVKAVAVGIGWKVGTTLGAKAGAVIGNAICPVVGGAIGAAVGAVVGFLGGCLGGWLFGKASDLICGKSEVEKALEEQQEQIAKGAATGTGEVSTEELAQSAYLKIGQSMAENGKLSDEDLEAKKTLENMLGEPLDVNEAKLAYQQCMSQENGTAAPTTTVAAQNTQTAAVATPAQTQQAATVTPQTTSLGDMYKSMEVYPYVNPYNTGMTGISLNLPTIPMYNRNLSYVA